MAHDVFLSYANPDREMAEAICTALERSKIRCWMAPRDIGGGVSYPEAIMTALSAARVMIVVVSRHANQSVHVAREVERAVDKKVAVMPIRVEDTPPSPTLEFFISLQQWIDAFPPPLADHLPTVVGQVQRLLGIVVSPSEVAKVELAPSAAVLEVGQARQLTATVRDSEGNVLLDQKITWSSSDGTVASVDGGGQVAGRTVGRVTITASAGGKCATAKVAVMHVPVAVVAVTPDTASVLVGETVQLSAVAKDESGNELRDRLITWSSTTPSIAAVDGSGLVTGKAAGTVTVTATCEGKTAGTNVTVRTQVSPPPRFSLKEVLEGTGLKFLEVSAGTFAVPFKGERTDQVVVQVKTLRDEFVFFVVPLPDPGGFSRETALRNLLHATFNGNYVKSITMNDQLAIAVELPTSIVTSDIAKGIVRGLVVMGDMKKKDVLDDSLLTERVKLCSATQAGSILMDTAAAEREFAAQARDAGVQMEQRQGNWLMVLEIGGQQLKVVVRFWPQVVSAIAFMGGTKPTGDRKAYMTRLHELNHMANVAKVGLDKDEDVALMYELPRVCPDAVTRIKEQFTVLLIGLVALHTGGGN